MELEQVTGHDPFLFNVDYIQSASSYQNQYQSQHSHPSSSLQSSGYYYSDTRSFQVCPSSGPSSPSSAASPYSYSPQNLPFPEFPPGFLSPNENSSFIKEEPDSYFGGNDTFLSVITEDISDSFSDIPDDDDSDLRYEDFVQFARKENFLCSDSSLAFDWLLYGSQTTTVEMDTNDKKDYGLPASLPPVPAPLSPSLPVSSSSTSALKSKHPSRTPTAVASSRGVTKKQKTTSKPSKKKNSLPTQASQPDVTEVFSAMSGSEKWSRESSVRSSPSLSGSSLYSDDSGGSRRSAGSRRSGGSRQSTGSKGSVKDRSPEAYQQRREKNNIAVRKSREKKRDEIKKFADEHMKLKREVEHIRTQNDKLKRLLEEVEEGIVEDKPKDVLAALLVRGKKVLNSD